MGARCWTRHEDNLLLEGRLNRESFEAIALKVGRSVKACRQRFDKATSGMGRELQDNAEIREGSKALGEAINALINRMTQRQIAAVLGTPHLVIPGTERIYRGQFAERKLAA
jgi:outer membrane protein assembly factor BamE (lipoprotein component of BamABCDE complex)